MARRFGVLEPEGMVDEPTTDTPVHMSCDCTYLLFAFHGKSLYFRPTNVASDLGWLALVKFS